MAVSTEIGAHSSHPLYSRVTIVSLELIDFSL